METSESLSIYHHHHHKKRKNSTRVILTKIAGGDELPVDIIYNILSRMPLKCLARFQCVSKVWCKYINDPYLEIMHAKRAMKDPTMLIMIQLGQHLKCLHTSASLSMLVTKEEKEEEESGATGTHSSHEEVVITTKNPLYMKFCTRDGVSRFIPEDIILGSCKGLILSSQDHRPPHNNVDNTTVLLVINPLKKECYRLPPIKFHSCKSLFTEREACGLGFDDSTNTCKMVCVVLRNKEIVLPDYSFDDVADVVKEDLCTMVHVLGTNASSSWREIPQVPPYPISGEAVFANGCLHWLVSFYLKYMTSSDVRKVIYFDMMKEEFGLIDPPNTLTGWVGRREHLVDLDGQVRLVYDDTFRKCFIEVWLLDYKTNCWVLHCRFDKRPYLPPSLPIKVIGYWSKDVGDLLITYGLRTDLFIYRLKRGILHEANFIFQDIYERARTTDIRLYQNTLFSSTLRGSIKNR